MSAVPQTYRVDLEQQAYDYLKAGAYRQAATLFEILATSRPDDPRGHAGLAWIAESEWQWATAIKKWSDCLAAAADGERCRFTARKAHCLLRMGKTRQASTLFRSIADTFDGLQGLAQIATLQQHWDVASRAWKKCTTEFPDQIGGFLGLANLQCDCDKYDEAEELLTHVVAVWPESIAAEMLLARCATARKDWETARVRWEMLAAGDHAIDRDFRAGYTRFLAVLADSAQFDSFLATVSGDPLASNECLLEYHLARDDYETAVEYSRKLVDLDPQSMWRRLQYASLLMRHGSFTKMRTALPLLQGLHDLCPDSVEVKIYLAEAYIKLGFDRQAKKILLTVPPDENRIGVELLRSWARHQENNDEAAKQSWNVLSQRHYIQALHGKADGLVRIDDSGVSIHPEDIVLFSVMRNEEPRIEWFLAHYRNLGVDRFVIVDNTSSDNTAQTLLGNHDVISYRTSDHFSMSSWGARWVNELIERHAPGNWCLFADADEALLFPAWEKVKLRGLTEYLTENGYEAMLAPLLDMYPTKIPSGKRTDLSVADRVSKYSYFDNQRYVYGHPICPYQEIFGGIRRRLFGMYNLSNKAPLINAAAGVKFILTSHQITPAKMADVSGALLHYHLFYLFEPDCRPLFSEAIARREFASNSLERLRSQELLPNVASLGSLLCESSTQFKSGGQLLDLGLMQASGRFLKWKDRTEKTARAAIPLSA